MLRTPTEAAATTTRSISSKDRISAFAIQGSPASGMQYVQRRLQRSVTEMRKYVIGRANASASGAAGARPMRSIVSLTICGASHCSGVTPLLRYFSAKTVSSIATLSL